MRPAALLLAAALAACSRPKPGDVPTIRFGADECARCGMAVSEERFAAGYVDGGGRSVAYDDVGELLQAMTADPSLELSSFVHDAGDGRWLRAAGAFFLRVPGLATPMGTGWAAFSSEARARAFAARLGPAAAPLSLPDAVKAAAPK